MTFEATPCRFVRRTGQVPTVTVWWGSCIRGQHVARFPYLPAQPADPALDRVPDGWLDAVPPDGMLCEGACSAEPGGGAPWLADAPDQHRAAGVHWRYDTLSGQPEPGDLYWADHRRVDWCPGRWDNCDGVHLHCVLPNGHEWDVDSRARNCALPDDRQHRCWVRRGDPEADPPTVHVSKDGPTCAAGAGSISSGSYHGHLHVIEWPVDVDRRVIVPSAEVRRAELVDRMAELAGRITHPSEAERRYASRWLDALWRLYEVTR